MGHYRLLKGKHTHNPLELGSNNKPLARNADTRKVYEAGNIIESEGDLVEKFGTEKFERVDRRGRSYSEAEVPVQRQPRMNRADAEPEPIVRSDVAVLEAGDEEVDLEAMKLDELRAFAAEEEIDLGTATRKDDIIKAIRVALG